MSNRCGHNKKKLKLCDIVKRGKGGQPRVLGIISAHLSEAARKRTRLKDWHYHLRENGTGRGRRSESREAGIAVLQFLTANWLQVETRRCAMPGTDYLECPDVKFIARAISRSQDWQGIRLSVGRVYAALTSLVEAGYITRSKQKHEQIPDGTWRSSPKIITFTKKFFLHVGGKRLWRTMLKTGKLKIERMKHALAKHSLPGVDIRTTLGEYLTPPDVVTPKHARAIRRMRPPDWLTDRPHLPYRPNFT